MLEYHGSPQSSSSLPLEQCWLWSQSLSVDIQEGAPKPHLYVPASHNKLSGKTSWNTHNKTTDNQSIVINGACFCKTSNAWRKEHAYGNAITSGEICRQEMGKWTTVEAEVTSKIFGNSIHKCSLI